MKIPKHIKCLFVDSYYPAGQTEILFPSRCKIHTINSITTKSIKNINCSIISCSYKPQHISINDIELLYDTTNYYCKSIINTIKYLSLNATIVDCINNKQYCDDKVQLFIQCIEDNTYLLYNNSKMTGISFDIGFSERKSLYDYTIRSFIINLNKRQKDIISLTYKRECDVFGWVSRDKLPNYIKYYFRINIIKVYAGYIRL